MSCAIGTLSCFLAPRAACLIPLRSSANRPGRTSRFLSCPPNWAVVALLPRHELLRCLIIMRCRATDCAEVRSAGGTRRTRNVALMRHALLRAHRRRGGVGAHVRIGIAGPHPQTIWRGRGRPPHRQDIVLPAALGLHQNCLRACGSLTAELLLTAPSARRQPAVTPPRRSASAR